MAEALREVDGAAVEVVQQNRIPLAEGGGAHPDVHREIQHGAAWAHDVLLLRGGNIGEVNPADRARPGYEARGLANVQAVTDDLLELGRL